MLLYITLNTSYTKENTVTPVNEVVLCNPPKQGSLKCPISRSFTTSCVGLELRPLPSTGITRLPRYYEPLRHPSAPDLSLAGVRLIILITHWGFPCCARFPCVHAAATTPVQRLGVFFAHLTPPYQPSPEGVAGSACTSSFSRSYDVLWVAIDSASK